MQVELNVTQENIDANEKHFGSPTRCPIAVALKDILKENAYINVQYYSVLLGEPIDNSKYNDNYEEIPFTEDVPEAYTTGYGWELTPFKTMLDIPEKFVS